MPFQFGSDTMTVQNAWDLANGRMKGDLSKETFKRVEESVRHVTRASERNTPVYGVNTGFGPLCTTRISREKLSELQHNLLRSHSAGVGQPLKDQMVKLMLVTKIQALSLGYSGIRMEVLERLKWHLENDIIPYVPSQGSLGASGDLTQLAHMSLPVIGEGRLWYQGKWRHSSEILKSLDKRPLKLGPKEGLALINGTQYILALSISAIVKLRNLFEHADLIAAITIEALKGSRMPFHPQLHSLRRFRGSIHVANKIWTLLQDSDIMASHIDCEKVQDPYSIRCVPAVHGAAWNALEHLKKLTAIELNSVTDNPVVLNEDMIISGGNFHGQPLAIPLDYMTIAASETGNISERRTYLLLSGMDNLPVFLTKNAGVESGFMIAQYTAAALVSENKSLCHPSSADSIMTSLGQEDHVSMGPGAGRKLHLVIGNLEKILAIELLTACQAIQFRRPMKTSPILEQAISVVRERVPFQEKDTSLTDSTESIVDLIREGTLVNLMYESGKIILFREMNVNEA